jgi:hypothetical protein
MLSNSIENITEDYEFLHKRKAYYSLVRDAAEKEIVANIDTPHRAWKAQEAFDKATATLEHINFEEDNINRYTKTNGKYIQSLCSLTFDNDTSSEHTLKRVVEKFTSMLDGTRKEPIWKTLTPEGIEPTDEDIEWFKLLFKREVNPEYTFNYKVSQLDKLHTDAKRIASSCTIQIKDLSTRVRFTYADSPDEPMANTYVFYWMYGEGDLKDKLATAPTDLKFFNETNSMLPLGIGLTDEFGYLVKSTQMGDLMKKFQETDLENATFEVKPGTVYGGWSQAGIIKDNEYENLKARTFDPRDRNKMKAFIGDPWNQWLNTRYFEKVLTSYNKIEKLGPKNGLLPEITGPSRILHSYVTKGYFRESEDTVEGLSIHEKDQFDHASSQYFFPDREYGFFAYPVNRGNFKTKNLLELAQSNDSQDEQCKAPVAWRGMVPLSDSEDEQPESIQLHCTLPEWDRRITVKLDTLNIALRKVAEKVKSHTENIERLTGMSRLVSLQQKFPYDVRGDDQIEIGNKLIGKVDQLAQAINDKLNPEENSLFVTPEDLEEVDQAAEALKQMIFGDAFLLELNTYLKSIMKEKGSLESDKGSHNPGPYMQTEPYWGHIFETLMQCIAAFSQTKISEHVWTEWVEPLLEDFSNQEEVINFIFTFNNFSEFSGLGKQVHGLEDRLDVEEPPPVRAYRIGLTDTFEMVQETLETKEEERLEKEALDLAHGNPLLWAFNCYEEVASPLFHRAPGAPSILQQVIDLYSDNISQKMMKIGGMFHIKFNVALFRLCGVHEINGQMLPKSLINKIALTGYIAQSPLNERAVYIKRLRSIDGIRNRKVDAQIREALDLIAPEALDGKQTLSETLYKANSQKWYKTLMFGTTAAVNIFTLANLTDSLKGKTQYEQALSIMEAATSTFYSAHLANNYIAAMSGRSVGEFLAEKGTAVKASADALTDNKAVIKWIGEEAAARYVAAVAVLLSIQSANEQYEEGNQAKVGYHLATALNTLHIQLAYAARQGAGRGALMAITQKAATRSAAARVMAMGLSALAVPVVGEAALIVASVIGACLVIYDVAEGVQAASRTGLYHAFHHYEKAISQSKVPVLNQHCHELYANELAESEQGLFDRIKDISDKNFMFDGDSYEWGHLCWRAVVPLYLQNYPTHFIEGLVKLDRTTTETTRIYGKDQSRDVRLTVESVKDIIRYYTEMAHPESSDETMPSGRKKHEIAESLARGDFIPENGMTEDLAIHENGKDKLISFDHTYFRQAPSESGLDWDALQEASLKHYPTNYLT